MKFWIISTAFIVLCFYLLEFRGFSEVDSSWKLTIEVVLPANTETEISYALVTTEDHRHLMDDLDVIAGDTSGWRNIQSKLDAFNDAQLTIPKFNMLDAGTQTISIPRTMLRSPVLNRDLGTKLPYERMICRVKNDSGLWLKTIGEKQWNEGLVTLNVGKIVVDPNFNKHDSRATTAE